MRILIPTHVQDLHARAVALALEAKGHEAVLWFGADYPTRLLSSIEVSPGGHLAWDLSGPEIEAGAAPFDVVWNRRPGPPVLPPEMHPADRVVAARECASFYRALLRLLAPDAFWVNSLAGHERASHKPLQLLEAARSGLRIPPTLFSNDRERILRFLDRHAGKVVYKGFNPAQWAFDGSMALLFTAPIEPGELPEEEVLRLCAGIFQRRVEKAHELRVTFLGDRAITAKLRSQECEGAQLDWRGGFDAVPIEPSELPRPVAAACRRLMRRLGVVFGCFDFVVTPEGEHVFLEMNEMGQFLWIEELAPEIRLLDPFCELLLERRRDFAWSWGAESVAYEEVRQAAEERDRECALLHVVKPNYHRVEESAPAQ